MRKSDARTGCVLLGHGVLMGNGGAIRGTQLLQGGAKWEGPIKNRSEGHRHLASMSGHVSLGPSGAAECLRDAAAGGKTLYIWH